MQLIVMPHGDVRCVYGEEFELGCLGDVSITRASHVEPTADGRWTADLRPVGGPVLGSYSSRSQALSIERRWLETNWL